MSEDFVKPSFVATDLVTCPRCDNLFAVHDCPGDIQRKLEELQMIAMKDAQDAYKSSDPEDPDFLIEDGRVHGITQCIDLIRLHNKHQHE